MQRCKKALMFDFVQNHKKNRNENICILRFGSWTYQNLGKLSTSNDCLNLSFVKDEHTCGKKWLEMVVTLSFIIIFHFRSDYRCILMELFSLWLMRRHLVYQFYFSSLMRGDFYSHLLMWPSMRHSLRHSISTSMPVSMRNHMKGAFVLYIWPAQMTDISAIEDPQCDSHCGSH